MGNNGLVLSHLKYEDDNLLVDDPFLENLWCIMAILRGSDRVLGLPVIFFKSRLIGVNVDQDFLNSFGDFLHREIYFLSFKYIGWD